MLKLAIIGVGWAGERQIQAIRELGRKVEVVSLVDNDSVFLAQKAAESGISTTYTDYHDALRDSTIDAVSICLPHQLHHPVALDAARAGKHILCEKPLAMTVDDATAMIDAAEAHGVRLFVAENFAYTSQAAFLRGIVSSGEFIGELIAVSVAWGFQAQNFGYPGRRAWLTQPEQGGTGTWMLHGIHTMAQVRYIFGEVETVYLQEHRAASFQHGEIEGTMTGVLTLRSGVHVTILQTCEIAFPHNLGGYVLHGDRGSLRASSAGYEVFGGTADPPGIQPYPAALLTEYALEIEAFADYVAGDESAPTTGRSERRSLAIVQAGYESMQSGQPINLAARFGDL
ncbi:MAG TPA: Gfo/Idh/MocA family oxidoreductase [Aggregatilineales bacterium]|nr:Gfo/Idh/MocA family oxidoreductase [Aggregatilineales bacterium]